MSNDAASQSSVGDKLARLAGMREGIIIAVSGPSGAGKTTLCRSVRDVPGLRWSVSVTTRRPRPGEREGVDYHFVTSEEFRRYIESGELAEHAEVHGNFYGTPRAPLDSIIKEGGCILVDVDIEGVDALRRRYGAAILTVFVSPSSETVLAGRLAKRKTESVDEVAGRLARAAREMARKNDFDVVVVNDDLERAVACFRSLLRRFIE